MLDQGLSALLTLVATFGTRQALALPSFAVQTGQPCANCHIGAFGPQPTPQGRDFKLPFSILNPLTRDQSPRDWKNLTKSKLQQINSAAF